MYEFGLLVPYLLVTSQIILPENKRVADSTGW